jgi:hypothetical protein
MQDSMPVGTQNRRVAITMKAVVETPYTALDAAPWPIATLEPGAWLTLDGTCGDSEAGLFVATVVRVAAAITGDRQPALFKEAGLVRPAVFDVEVRLVGPSAENASGADHIASADAQPLRQRRWRPTYAVSGRTPVVCSNGVRGIPHPVRRLCGAVGAAREPTAMREQ